MISPLPIDEIVPDIVQSLRSRNNAVVVAPPGAGKTTRLPPALARTFSTEGRGAVVVLQPRRVAARASAARIAQEQGWRLGEEVGYQIRFENRTGPRTVIRVVTEGILTRRLQSDPYLDGVACVVLDEFHERSIHTDLALAMLWEIQSTVREDLRIVVMSATMNPAPVAKYLGNAPVFESRGRIFPVAVDYVERTSTLPIWDQASQAVRRAAAESREGHILVFLPGIGEIHRTAGLIRDLNFDLHILHSSVSSEAQDRALQPSSRRKIILATNIAETSITIDGVTMVIDSGWARVLVNDPRLGIDRLEMRRVSRASADQRAGRAGRNAPGKCLRLWSPSEDAVLVESESPEIQRVDLTSTVLALKSYGLRDPMKLDWFEAPREENCARAEQLLMMLGATAPNGTLTKLGKTLARLPVHPRLGCILIAGQKAGRLQDAATLAALLSEREILAEGHRARRRQARVQGASDLLDRLERIENPADDDLNSDAVRAVLRLRDELIRIGRNLEGADAKKAEDDTALLRVILHAYPDRVTLRRPNDRSRGVMVGARSIVLEPSSVVQNSRLFLSLDPRDDPSGGEARVALASAIEEEWLAEIFPHLVQSKLTHAFDEDRRKVIGRRQKLFAGLVIDEDAVGSKRTSEAAEVLFQYLRKDVQEFFRSDENAARWLARVGLLRRFMPDLEWPLHDAESMEHVLRSACEGSLSADEVRAKGLDRFLESSLNPRQKKALLDHAPEALSVPSGSRIRLQYADEKPPILAVRMQELFGLPETPRIAAGRVPVTLQLLAPNSRPVQVTSDLKSFWNTTYPEVRRQLKIKYPKHPWPEDPWNAPPAAVGRRRRT